MKNFKLNKKIKNLICLTLSFLMTFTFLTNIGFTSEAATDKTAPTATSLKVSNLNSSGYKITCNVSDKGGSGIDKVLVATWTKSGGQDDLVWDTASVKNGKVTYSVKVSDHSYERGTYYSHVYVYDKAGNSRGYSSLGSITVPVKTINISSVKKQYPDYSTWNGSYKGVAWQCHGFALTIANKLTGTNPLNWKKTYSLTNIEAGDIIRFNRPHTILVTAVSTDGKTITYVDCNWYAKNTVKWNQKISVSKLTSKFGKLSYVLKNPT